MKIAIFASGNGSNFQALAESIQGKTLNCELGLLFCDQKKAYVLERGKKLGVPTFCFAPKDFSSKEVYEEKILAILKENEIEGIILAGYLRIIGKTLLEAYPQRIVNLHPSLLPKYKGLHGIKDAFEAEETVTGVTVHLIDEGLDSGPILAQEKVQITKDDTLKSLEEKIHQTEHQLYPKVIQELLEKGW